MLAEQIGVASSLTGKAPILWSHAAIFFVKQRPLAESAEFVAGDSASEVSFIRVDLLKQSLGL
jgi:hypothetical protein